MVVTGYDPKAIVVTPLDDSVDFCRPLPVGWACKVGTNRASQMTELPFFVEATPKGRRDRELARAASLTLWTQLCAGQPYFNRGEPQPGNADEPSCDALAVRSEQRRVPLAVLAEPEMQLLLPGGRAPKLDARLQVPLSRASTWLAASRELVASLNRKPAVATTRFVSEL